MFEQCEQEIVELHEFFERWLSGDFRDTAAAFARVSDVLAERFLILSPGGERRERRQLLEELRQAYGSRGKKGPFRIWIEKIEGRFRVGGLALVTYEEWQQEGDVIRGRASSALFHERADAPHGIEWLHLHETWLPEGRTSEPPGDP